MPKENQRENINPFRPNFWGFLQSTLISAVNKGQLPYMAVTLVMLILVIKYPKDEIPKLIENLTDISKTNSIIGWVLFVGVSLLAISINKWQRKIHKKEIKRISSEKRLLQEKLLKKELPSSKN